VIAWPIQSFDLLRVELALNLSWRKSCTSLFIYHTDWYFCQNCFWFDLCKKTVKFKAGHFCLKYEEMSYLLFSFWLAWVKESLLTVLGQWFWWLALFANGNIPRVARERRDVICALSIQALQCQKRYDELTARACQCPWDLYIEMTRLPYIINRLCCLSWDSFIF